MAEDHPKSWEDVLKTFPGWSAWDKTFPPPQPWSTPMSQQTELLLKLLEAEANNPLKPAKSLEQLAWEQGFPIPGGDLEIKSYPDGSLYIRRVGSLALSPRRRYCGCVDGVILDVGKGGDLTLYNEDVIPAMQALLNTALSLVGNKKACSEGHGKEG